MANDSAAPRHHSIDYIEINVENLAAAKAFYGEAFGWKFNDYGPTYSGIQGPEREVGGLAEGPGAGPGGPLVVLYSDALEDSVRAVESAGGTVTKPIFAFPGGRRFHFHDPSGNELAVWSTAS